MLALHRSARRGRRRRRGSTVLARHHHGPEPATSGDRPPRTSRLPATTDHGRPARPSVAHREQRCRSLTTGCRHGQLPVGSASKVRPPPVRRRRAVMTEHAAPMSFRSLRPATTSRSRPLRRAGSAVGSVGARVKLVGHRDCRNATTSTVDCGGALVVAVRRRDGGADQQDGASDTPSQLQTPPADRGTSGVAVAPAPCSYHHLRTEWFGSCHHHSGDRGRSAPATSFEPSASDPAAAGRRAIGTLQDGARARNRSLPDGGFCHLPRVTRRSNPRLAAPRSAQRVMG